MAKFLQLIGTIKRNIFRKVRTETIFENIQHLNCTYILYGSENWTHSLTETKIWSGRNEIIETSGRLLPSWPQNKRLYTPWTKNYRHTRQDRSIQTELAFRLAKNATKPNPVDIIPLQATKKENNWKTEGTLARKFVTLETERIKLVQLLMFMMTMVIKWKRTVRCLAWWNNT